MRTCYLISSFHIHSLTAIGPVVDPLAKSDIKTTGQNTSQIINYVMPSKGPVSFYFSSSEFGIIFYEYQT